MPDNCDDGELPEHVRENRAYWDGMADEGVAMGERAWRAEDTVLTVLAMLQRLPGRLRSTRAQVIRR